MRTDLDHLPPAKQHELKRILAILFEEFEDAAKLATSERKKAGRILKVVLFGSFARGNWVEDRASGYLSDYDLLVVVNHEELTDAATYWYKAEDRFARPGGISRPVNLIVHTLGEVNNALAQGQYFFTDIVREGIALYAPKGHDFVEPKPLSGTEAYEIAKGYFSRLFDTLSSRIETSRFQRDRGSISDTWRREAAFTLHQAAEAAYGCLLLTCTLFLPKTHNLERLRSLARQIDPRLEGAWPSDSRLARRRFQLLKRAYVEARYSPHYQIGADDLEWLAACVERLRELVGAVCEERLRKLEQASGNASGSV